MTCRVDNDCFLGHICLNNRCIFACHTDEDCSASESCRNNTCTNPCTASPCGPNAVCSITNHRATCSCLTAFMPNPTPTYGCVREPANICASTADCPPSFGCVNALCRPGCSADTNCVSNERCEKGVCQPMCRRDDECRTSEICQDLICVSGCRTDNECASHESCINQQCADPCAQAKSACGSCAECSVINHAIQCTCAAGMIGNGYEGCSQQLQRCDSYCQCDEHGFFCAQTCNLDAECGCGQKCSGGKCRTKCNPGACPAGQLCQRGACVAGCRSNGDCPTDLTCINRLCLNPCLKKETCNDERALCKVNEHRAYCMCPDGSPKDPKRRCEVAECVNDNQCSAEKRCDGGICQNPCLQDGACGRDAQCRVVNRHAECSCPPGRVGNPLVECTFAGGCAGSSCGPNSQCHDLPGGGVKCMCQQGCVGSPITGCLCTGNAVNPCLNKQCGERAVCSVNAQHQPECHCPPDFPIGDPVNECKFHFFFCS